MKKTGLISLLVCVLCFASTLLFSCTSVTDGQTADNTDVNTENTTDIGIGGADMHYTYVDIVERMLDTRYLSEGARGEKSAEFTSYDRASTVQDIPSGVQYNSWNANSDGTGYIRQTEDGGYVIAEMKGPGYISRIWSATASSGNVKIYIDGSDTPLIDMPFSHYFTGGFAPFNYSELSYDDSARGKNCYVPITYNKSCYVVAYGDWGKYYHINYTTLSEGSSVDSLTLPMSEEQRTALKKVNDFYAKKIGTNPDGSADAPFEKYTVSSSSPIIKTLTGKGAINGLLVRVDNNAEPNCMESVELLKRLRIKIYYDSISEPYVDAPLGDFFGSAYGVTDIATLLIGVREDNTFYNYFYMPYLESARIEISYSGDGKVGVELSVGTADHSIDADGLMYFSTVFTTGKYHENPQRHPDYLFLSAEGEGRLVGVTLHVSKSSNIIAPDSTPGSPWWGEGDEKFFVDGEVFPSWFGTGTEDFFGYAWCSAELFTRAMHAQSYCVGGSNQKGNRSVTRLFIGDSVPFYDSFEGYIEKYYSDEHVKYGITSYLYLAPGAKVEREEYTSDELASYFTFDPGAIPSDLYEGEWMKVTGSSVGAVYGPQGMAGFGGAWSENSQIFIRGLGVGGWVELELGSKTSGRYMLIASFTQAKDYGKIKISINGADAGGEYDMYSASVVAERLTALGEVELTEGFTNKFRITVTGKNAEASNYYVGLDFVLLIPCEEYSGTENIDLSLYTDVKRINAKNEAKDRYLFEGEDFSYSRVVSAGSTSVQQMTGWGSYWSGGKQLWWTKAKQNDTLKLRVFVNEAGQYSFSGGFTRAVDYGAVEFYVNGVRLNTTFDGYNRSVVYSHLDFGSVTLNAGYNEITIKITGKNSAATNYMVGVDHLLFEKK